MILFCVLHRDLPTHRRPGWPHSIISVGNKWAQPTKARCRREQLYWLLLISGGRPIGFSNATKAIAFNRRQISPTSLYAFSWETCGDPSREGVLRP